MSSLGVTDQKGGSEKVTATVILAAVLSSMACRVLLHALVPRSEVAGTWSPALSWTPARCP